VAERRLVLLGLATVAALLTFAIAASGASACGAAELDAFGISPGCFDQQISAAPAEGDLAPNFTQAGGHPYTITESALLNAPSANHNAPPEALRNLSLSLSPGIAANVSATPTCTMRQMSEELGLSAPPCPPGSQVGVVDIEADLLQEGLVALKGLPIYSLGSSPGSPARFGIAFLAATIVLEGRLGSDGGLTMTMANINQSLSVDGAIIQLWGVPADTRHTPERSCPGEPAPSQAEDPKTCAAGVPPRALLRLPTNCDAPPLAAAEVDSWDHPGAFVTESVANHAAPGLLGDPTDAATYPVPFPGLDSSQWGPPQSLSGCDRVPFDPRLTVDGTSHEAAAATGLDVQVSFPQQGFEDSEAVAESDLRSAKIDFPPGISVNAAMANGLGACTAVQAGLGSSDPASCPDAAKLGTAEMRSPMVSTPLSGSIYLAKRENGASDLSLPVYVVAEGEGTVVKLGAQVRLDESSGRLQADFEEAPQVPLERLRLAFFGGPRAPFVNPPSCGSYAFDGLFTPWARPAPVATSAPFQVSSGLSGQPCPGPLPFTPKIGGGSNSVAAHQPTSFAFRLTRPEGQQEMTSFDVSLPSGLSASLRGVPRCSDAAIAGAAAAGRSGADELAAPSCPAGSRLGRFGAQLGAGSEPFALDTGRVYLAGPYEGAPFSLAVIAPGVAGPLDFGTLVVRLPVRLDSRSGRVEIAGRLPTTKRGLRLGLRQISLQIDRPGFIRNPSGCGQKSLDATVGGSGGAQAQVSAPFRIRGCRKLGFSPALTMTALGGRAATHHAAHPGLRAAIVMHGKDAGMDSATITLPVAEQLDPAHLGNVCSREAFASQRGCPASTVYGQVRLRTPILDKPLRGPVYMRASEHRFPDLVAALGGEIDLNLPARLTFANGRVRLVFDSLPDVPMSKLVLTVKGGKRGILINSRDLCRAPASALVGLGAQNGRFAHFTAPLETSCG
jgi:hypothetical protein